MDAIALQQARQHRQLDVVLLGDVGERAQVFRQDLLNAKPGFM
jgi:hypothetical protein